eukprot:g1122.t1
MRSGTSSCLDAQSLRLGPLPLVLSLLVASLLPSAVIPWTTLPDELLKTPFGYQVMSDTTPTIEGGKIKCDTPFMCKTAVVSDSIGSCTICEAEIGIPASPYYGADLDVEVSPYDLHHLPSGGETAETSSGSEAGMTSDSGSSASSSSGSGNPAEKCPSRVDDEFVLPCCPSCCRWCKDICDDLESSVPRLQRLWWSLCNGEDSTEGTEKDEFYSTIANSMYPRKTVGGGGMSKSPMGKAMNSKAGAAAGMAAGLLRL